LIADPNARREQNRAVVAERFQPAVRFLSEGLMHLITEKRKTSQVSLSMYVHNLTSSKELISVLKKLNIGISYDDVLDELSALALQEQQYETNSNVVSCPHHIASGQPGTVVMDNDDFREDGLTGSETSHYTNVIMAQPIFSRREGNSIGTTLVIPTPELKEIWPAVSTLNTPQTMAYTVIPDHRNSNTMKK
jgi:hypothetical protein